MDGVQHSATAFLVGKFDIAVTVAHAFEFEHRVAQLQECKYLVYGPLGQIRERIPLTQIHSQWRAQQETFGRPDCDLAVIRLAESAHLPQKTLALSKFAFTGAPISLIGFSPHLGTDPQQRRLRGEVYAAVAEQTFRQLPGSRQRHVAHERLAGTHPARADRAMTQT